MLCGLSPGSTLVFLSRLSQERPKRTVPSLRQAFEKNFRKKTSQNIWQFENNSLPLHPLLRSEPRTKLRKKLRKKFRKNLEDMRKTPYLCNRFPEKRRRHKRAIFDEIYINNTVVQERNWKQFRVNKRTVSTYIYR